MSDFYFTFPDRGLTYDCRGCGACCRGLGIGVDATAGELERLVAAQPAIAPFVRRRGAALTVFNPRDRCWFLDDGGLCQLETDGGREAKPASCRLFPFNRVFRVGSMTVVNYNSVICPLRAAPDGDGIPWADVRAEIEAVRDPALVGTALPVDDLDTAGGGFAVREPRIAGACFAGGTWRDVWSAMDDRDADEAWQACARALGQLSGSEPALPTGGTMASALLATPSMRFNELYGPRQYAARAAMAAVLPGMWLAWLALAGQGASAARRDLGMQELTTIWSEVAPVGYLAARWDEQPHFAPGPVELPGTDADPKGVVRRFGEACARNRTRAKTLGEMWIAAAGSLPPEARFALAKLAEPILRKLRW